MRLRSIRLVLGALLAFGFFLTGCESIGPSRVPSDRFDYNESIAQSSKTQMLLNLVRMRYRDTPVFLAVSSVLNRKVIAA